MSSEDFFDVSVYILKGDESIGPFSIDELLETLETGRFELSDVCLREGATETERIRDILDWEDDSHSLKQMQETENDSASEDPEEDIEEPVCQDSTPSTLQGNLYVGHPSMLNYPFSVFCAVGGVIGSVWLFPIDLRFSILSLAVCCVGFGYLSFVRFTRDYLISPKRVEVISGLIAKSSNEIQIKDIRAINVSCSGLTGILGIGNVDFFTTGDDPEVRFERVWAAKKIKLLVRSIQDQF